MVERSMDPTDRGDPDEGVGPDGTIRTGVDLARVPPPFEGVLADAIAVVPSDTELYLYGSVATGRAVPTVSDVDLLTIGLEPHEASALSSELTARHRSVGREIAISAARSGDVVGDRDEAYGNRVFLRHYCVQLSGPERDIGDAFPADRRAARGFNGDIDRHRARWIGQIGDTDPSELARLVARKTLLAVAGIVSVRQATWTTNRHIAAQRWTAIEPHTDDGVLLLADWAESTPRIARIDVEDMLRSTVALVVERFDEEIGLWD